MKNSNFPFLALVALLIALLSFRDPLSTIMIGQSSVSIFQILIISTCSFGCILYIHLLSITISSLIAMWKRRKINLNFVLYISVLLTLILIPLGTLAIFSSDWLNERYCIHVYDTDPFDPFTTVGNPYEVCKSRWESRVMPILLVSLIVLPMGLIFYNQYSKEKKKDPILRNISAQLAELRIFQAMTANEDAINNIQKLILQLEHDYSLRQAALDIKKPRRKN